MTSHTVTDLPTNKFSSLLGCGAEQFPVILKALQSFKAVENTYPLIQNSTNNF